MTQDSLKFVDEKRGQLKDELRPIETKVANIYDDMLKEKCMGCTDLEIRLISLSFERAIYERTLFFLTWGRDEDLARQVDPSTWKQ